MIDVESIAMFYPYWGFEKNVMKCLIQLYVIMLNWLNHFYVE